MKWMKTTSFYLAFYFFLFFTLITISQYLVKSLYIYPKIRNAQEKFSLNSIKVLNLAIEDSLSRVVSTTIDYSNWDDMYNSFFLEPEKKEEFFNRTFSPDALINLDLDYIGIYDINNKTYLEKFLNKTNKTFITDKNFLKNLIDTADKRKIRSLDSIKGIYSYSDDNYFFSICSIKKSDKTGSPVGYFLFAKKIDETFISDLGYKNNMGIEYIKSSQYKFNRIVSIIDRSEDDYYYDENNSHFIYYKDSITGNPIFALKFDFYDGISTDDIDTKKERSLNIVIAFFIMTVLYKLSKRKTVTPIKNLNEHIKSIINTNVFSELKLINPTSEVEDLIISFNKLVKKINFQNEQIGNINEYMNKLAYIDPLTKISNRRKLEEKFGEYVLMSKKSKVSLGLILCDIDYFKNYNDFYGHIAGDNALVEVANVLKESCQKNSSYEAFRYGGEEFVILLYDIDTIQLEEQIRIVQKGIANLDIKHEASSVNDILTLTFGAIKITANEHTQLNVILNQADEELYRAKKAGRNRFIIG